MEKMNAKGIIYPAFILFAACLVVTAALAGTKLLTADKIAENDALAATAARSAVIEASDFKEADGYYLALDDAGSTIGYIFETNALGYGGLVSVMTGISVDGVITGVEVVSHSETPGLGANATKEEFREQFKQNVSESGFSVVKSGNATTNEVNALTGATITSKAVTNAVNKAMALFNEIV